MANSSRVGGIDFWRGCVLIAILIDHVPGNLLELLTPRNFGFSDSAEAFVFLSGLSVGIVYLPRANRHGIVAVGNACLRRAVKLYGAHIALTLAALLIFAAAWRLSGVDNLIAAHGRSFVFAAPASGLAGLAALTHQLGYFNILPLYVVLMLWAPVAIFIALKGPPLALAASLSIYAGSRLLDLRLPTWPEPGSWFFNPFAWQLVFTIGLVCAVLWSRGPPRPSVGLVALSGGVLAAALIATGAAGLAPALRDAASAHLDVAKQDLGLARLGHFIALVYLISVAPGFARLAEGTVGRAVQRLGRNSLPVFAAGSLLSAVGQAALEAAEGYASPELVHFAGFTYTLTGVALLFALARWIECKDSSSPPSDRVFSPAAPQPL